MKNIPIAAAKRISQEYEAPIVIVFAIDPTTGTQHITTYGDTLAHCEAAARGGNHMKQHLGWPEELCKDIPARQKRARKVKPKIVPNPCTCVNLSRSGLPRDWDTRIIRIYPNGSVVGTNFEGNRIKLPSEEVQEDALAQYNQVQIDALVRISTGVLDKPVLADLHLVAPGTTPSTHPCKVIWTGVVSPA